MSWIVGAVQVGGHNQAGFGTGSANEVEHLLVADQWLGSPVFGDLGEQAMLDGIPFGGTGGVVSDGNGEAEGVAQLPLDFRFPNPGSATVAAPGVGQKQKLGSAALAVILHVSTRWRWSGRRR